VKIVFGVLALCALVFFWPSLARMAKEADWNWAHPGSSELEDPGVKVWASKQVGYYYCPGSTLYLKAEPGMMMTQAQALETGYRPATGEYCK